MKYRKTENAQCGAFQTKYWISLRFSRYQSHSHCTYLNKHFYSFLRARASPFDARIVHICVLSTHACRCYAVTAIHHTNKKIAAASERALHNCSRAQPFFPSTFFNFYKSTTSLFLAHKSAFPLYTTYITWHFSHWARTQAMWLKQSHAKTKDLSEEPALFTRGTFRCIEMPSHELCIVLWSWCTHPLIHRSRWQTLTNQIWQVWQMRNDRAVANALQS